MNKYLKFIRRVNLKSLFFNLKYLPFRQAIKFPILVSRNVFILEFSGKVEIKGPISTGMIQIGYGSVGIFDMKRQRSIWEVFGKVVFNGKTHLGHGTKISVGKNGSLEFGKDFTLTAESAIISQKQIKFGDSCFVSWDCLIMDTDFHNIYDEYNVKINPPKQILIGNNVWIGCRNLILKGSKISDNILVFYSPL